MASRPSSAHPRESGGPERVHEGVEIPTLDARLRGHERMMANRPSFRSPPRKRGSRAVREGAEILTLDARLRGHER